MTFHPPFTFAREHRLIFGETGARPSPEGAAPGPELTPERKKAKEVVDALKDKLRGEPKNLNVIRELAALKVDEAEGDEERFQQAYRGALERAANAYFRTLEGTEEEKAKKVQELFRSAGAPDVRLEGGALQLAPSSPEKKERALTDEEKAMIDAAFSTHPQLKAAAEKLMTSLTPDNPDYETARGFFEAFNAKSPTQKKAILTNNRAFQQFLEELPADQKEFVGKLRLTMQETGKELSDDEMKDAVEKAQNYLKEKKFDYATATDIQKSLMLAQLQMLGMDVSGGEEILKDPSKLQALNGSPMERGFNKILGMISYILLSIQQMKDRLHPTAKTPTAPTGPSAGPSGAPGEGDMAKKVKEGDYLRERRNREEEVRRNTLALDGDPSAPDENGKKGLRNRELQLKKRDVDLQAEGETLEKDLKAAVPENRGTIERKIAENKTEREKIAAELKGIQEQKTKIEARNEQLTTEMRSLEDMQKRIEQTRQLVHTAQTEVLAELTRAPLAEKPEAKAIAGMLSGFKVILAPAQADDHFTVELQGVPDPATIDRAKVSAAVEAVRSIGGDTVSWELEGDRTLKNPDAFALSLRQIVEKLKTKPETRAA